MIIRKRIFQTTRIVLQAVESLNSSKFVSSLNKQSTLRKISIIYEVHCVFIKSQRNGKEWLRNSSIQSPPDMENAVTTISTWDSHSTLLPIEEKENRPNMTVILLDNHHQLYLYTTYTYMHKSHCFSHNHITHLWLSSSSILIFIWYIFVFSRSWLLDRGFNTPFYPRSGSPPLPPVNPRFSACDRRFISCWCVGPIQV